MQKTYKEDIRQCDKYLAKMNWYRSKSRNAQNPEKCTKESWKEGLNGVWRGSNRGQKRANGMEFGTILQVPSTRNSVLFNNLVKAEDKLVPVSGYCVKMVEQSGIQLSRLFPGMSSNTKQVR